MYLWAANCLWWLSPFLIILVESHFPHLISSAWKLAIKMQGSLLRKRTPYTCLHDCSLFSWSLHSQTQHFPFQDTLYHSSKSEDLTKYVFSSVLLIMCPLATIESPLISRALNSFLRQFCKSTSLLLEARANWKMSEDWQVEDDRVSKFWKRPVAHARVNYIL